MKISIPAEMPDNMIPSYTRTLETITHGTGNLLLFAGDQKIEHMNEDFYGEGISEENANPEHLFKIASQTPIGCFAAQFGLISRYGRDYPEIPYLVKLNSKTNLIPVSQAESISLAVSNFHMIDELVKQSHIPVVGVGYTIYVGSEHESQMFAEAARYAFEAHIRGMIAVFWMYPRGKAVPKEKNPHIIAGAAGIGACLGADYVKVNYPSPEDGTLPAESLKEAVQAAGRTKLICAGGSHTSTREYLQHLHDQIHISGAHGTAAGRNIHQRSLEEAIKFTNAVAAVIYQNTSVDDALKIAGEPS